MSAARTPTHMQGLAAYLRSEAGGSFVGQVTPATLKAWANEVDAATGDQPTAALAAPVELTVQPHGWLITYSYSGDKYTIFCGHNSVGDYRIFDKDATSEAVYSAATQPLEPISTLPVAAKGGV